MSAWEMISNQHFTEIALVSFQNLALVFILHLRNLHVKLAEHLQTTHTCICTSCSLSITIISNIHQRKLQADVLADVLGIEDNGGI